MEGNGVSILLNDGLMPSSAPLTNMPLGGKPYSVAIADLNGNGWSDLAVANLDSDNVSVLLNNGDGTFGASVLYPAGKPAHIRSPWVIWTSMEMAT